MFTTVSHDRVKQIVQENICNSNFEGVRRLKANLDEVLGKKRTGFWTGGGKKLHSSLKNRQSNNQIMGDVSIYLNTLYIYVLYIYNKYKYLKYLNYR